MKTLSGLFVILLLTLCSFTQIKDSAEGKNSLQKGNWAVQFQVGSNFTLNSFENVIVSLKTHLSPKFAVRFGVGLNAYSRDETFSYLDYYYGYGGTNIPLDNHETRITILAKMLYYFNPKSFINLFIGLGPEATYSQSYNEGFYLDGYKTFSEFKSWNAGLNGVLGCEIFPLHFLSLFAEYSASATYGKSTDKRSVKEFNTGTEEEFRDIEATYFNFTGNTVRLGLSLYF